MPQYRFFSIRHAAMVEDSPSWEGTGGEALPQVSTATNRESEFSYNRERAFNPAETAQQLDDGIDHFQVVGERARIENDIRKRMEHQRARNFTGEKA